MKKLKLGNLEVVLPEPYRQGHVCSAKEASILNTIHCKRLRENLTDQLSDVILCGFEKDLNSQEQIRIQQYIRNYSLNGRDPVETEAQTLALQVVKQTIKASGGLLKEWRDSDLRKQAEHVLSSKLGSTIRSMAVTRAEDLAEAVKTRLEENE